MLFTISSCNYFNSFEPENELQKMHLKGDVIAIQEEGNFTFFNQKGNIEKEITFDDKGKTLSFTTFFYVNDKLNKQETHSTGEESNTFYYYNTRYYYNRSGKLISDNSTFSIDINGIKGKVKSENYYFFDKYQKLIKLIHKTSHNIGGGGWDISKYSKFYYYTNDLLDSTVVRNSSNKSKPDIEIYKNNLLINSFKYDSNGTIRNDISETDYKYKFDAIGNWIERSYLKAGKRIVKTREIFYKGADIKKFSKMYDNSKMKYESGSNESQNPNSDNIMNEKSNSTNVIINSTENRQNLQSESQQKQWVNCKYCNGTGKNLCYHCNGSKQLRCNTCGGSGIYSGHTCGSCNGNGYNICGNCNGTGSDRNCGSCDGRGQVLIQY